MIYSVVWSKTALRDMKRLRPEMRARVNSAVKQFAEDGSGDVKPLKGKHKDKYRLRVGEYRVIFKVKKKELIMIVLRVLPRDSAY